MKKYKVIKIDWDAYGCDVQCTSNIVCIITVKDDISETEILKGLGNPDYEIERIIKGLENF